MNVFNSDGFRAITTSRNCSYRQSNKKKNQNQKIPPNNKATTTQKTTPTQQRDQTKQQTTTKRTSNKLRITSISKYSHFSQSLLYTVNSRMLNYFSVLSSCFWQEQLLCLLLEPAQHVQTHSGCTHSSHPQLAAASQGKDKWQPRHTH